MPRKRNRDDEQEQEKKQAPSTEVVVVKTEPIDSEETEDHRQTGDLDRIDKEELKGWVKELLQEQVDHLKEKDDLQKEKKDLQKLIELFKENEKKQKLVHKVHSLFNTAVLLPYRGEVRLFYPNPYLVEEVENRMDEEGFLHGMPQFQVCNVISSHIRRFVIVGSFSEIIDAFKDVRRVDEVLVYSQEEMGDFQASSRFYLNVVQHKDGEYLIVGAVATAPFNHKFGQEIKKLDVYRRLEARLGDHTLAELFPSNWMVEAATWVYYPPSLCDPNNEFIQVLDFWEKDDVVNVLLALAPSYDSKVKGYLPRRASREVEAEEVTFDLDKMVVTGNKLPELNFTLVPQA